MARPMVMERSTTTLIAKQTGEPRKEVRRLGFREVDPEIVEPIEQYTAEDNVASYFLLQAAAYRRYLDAHHTRRETARRIYYRARQLYVEAVRRLVTA